ncbi:hypothetical protein E2320_007098 [Naja naja]|nr:hypothetical protein E2320_007098 [Naja naja]
MQFPANGDQAEWKCMASKRNFLWHPTERFLRFTRGNFGMMGLQEDTNRVSYDYNGKENTQQYLLIVFIPKTVELNGCLFFFFPGQSVEKKSFCEGCVCARLSFISDLKCME